MNDADKKLLDKYESASKQIKAQMNTPKGGSQAENEYAIAYQKLVQAGLVGQIRKKYR